MRIARARPSPGTCSRCSTRRLDAGQADGVPRDHPPGHPPRHRQPPRHRPAPGRRPGGAAPARPHLRLRPAGRRWPARRSGRAARSAGSRASARAWWSSASASACAFVSAVLLGPRGRVRHRWRAPTRRSAPSAPPWWQLDGDRLAAGKDFGEDGRLRGGVAVLDEARAEPRWPTELADAVVRGARRSSAGPTAAGPSPPFITSTFQQEAGRKLRLSSSMAMRSAQSLYEAGYITYMRTDSTTLSETALAAARAEIAERYGAPVPARRAPALRQEGQERPGGPRGHPPGRRPLPLARAGGPRGRAAPRPRSTSSSGSARSPRR